MEEEGQREGKTYLKYGVMLAGEQMDLNHPGREIFKSFCFRNDEAAFQ